MDNTKHEWHGHVPTAGLALPLMALKMALALTFWNRRCRASSLAEMAADLAGLASAAAAMTAITCKGVGRGCLRYEV